MHNLKLTSRTDNNCILQIIHTRDNLQNELHRLQECWCCWRYKVEITLLLTDTNTFVVKLNVCVLYKYLACLIYFCNSRFLICFAYLIYLNKCKLFTRVRMGVLILFILFRIPEIHQSGCRSCHCISWCSLISGSIPLLFRGS